MTVTASTGNGTKLDYPIFDADEHYYEVDDTFTRFGDEKVRRHVRWVQEGKRRHLMFGNRLSTGVPNPTFNPIAKPGAFHDELRHLEVGGRPTGRDYGELEPLPEEYRNRDLRLQRLDEQGVDKVMLFPTLGQCVEHLMYDDVDMMYRIFRSFNRWLDDQWGFNFEDRIYAPPIIPMLDIDRAVIELEQVLADGARWVCLRPGPLYGRSPADPYFDPFWARVNEAGITVGYHAIGGASPYDDMYADAWCRPGSEDKSYNANLRQALFPGERPIMDTITSLVLGCTFQRFPNVRIASIEMGCTWVPYFLHSLDHAGGLLDRKVEAFGHKVSERPSEVFKRHVWISPFPEEDVVGLAELIGIDKVLMGSDWPHPEGNHYPAEYAECLDGLDDASIRRIMRENALSLIASPT
jgi:predicted TIM-barrel fold metal-dependent hydrolase